MTDHKFVPFPNWPKGHNCNAWCVCAKCGKQRRDHR